MFCCWFSFFSPADVFERKCCHIECFTLVDCKQMASKECSNVSVECAMGDAYRFTIQPVFQNIKTEFQCHIQHIRYEALYDLFYFIEIPNTGFQSPKIQRRVYAKDIGHRSHGEFTASDGCIFSVMLSYSVFAFACLNRDWT